MSSLETLYQQVILDHSRRRVGEGEIPEDVDGESYQVNPTCGDEITLGVHVKDGELVDYTWTGDGCSISQASISVMAELINGKSIAEISQLYKDFETMILATYGFGSANAEPKPIGKSYLPPRSSMRRSFTTLRMFFPIWECGSSETIAKERGRA